MVVVPTRDELIRLLPKVELHVHIEGTLEPDLLFALARRHGVALPYASVEELRGAYDFDNLQSFLDLYYAGCAVLRDREDFYALAMSYFTRAYADGVVHAELFFDPQTHTARGVELGDVVHGLTDALGDARKHYGITGGLIACFLRHLPEADALTTWRALELHHHELLGVGLDSSERDYPPRNFARVFAEARAAGLHRVAHAGEEGPASYIREALDILHVERIDHGVHCDDNPALVAELVARRVPLTMCPLSNLELCVVDDLRAHNLGRLLRAGVAVTVNSDDPAYFGGYIADNYRAIAEAVELSPAELVRLAENAARAAFLAAGDREHLLTRIRKVAGTMGL